MLDCSSHRLLPRHEIGNGFPRPCFAAFFDGLLRTYFLMIKVAIPFGYMYLFILRNTLSSYIGSEKWSNDRLFHFIKYPNLLERYKMHCGMSQILGITFEKKNCVMRKTADSDI